MRTARFMLATIFLMLFASHIAAPCALSGHGRAVRGGMCQENKFAKAGTDSNQYFQAPMPEGFGLPAAVTLAWIAVAAVIVAVIAKPNRFPLAFSARGRPFASSDPPRLSYFGAQRDA